MAEKQADIQMQTQGNIQSANAANQAKMQTDQATIQGKMQLSSQEHQQKMEQMREEARLKSGLMEKEFEFNMQLAGAENSIVEQREDKKERAKDERTKIQATQQSKLIEQRQRNLPSRNFESANDYIGDISLDEFDPR